MASEEATGRVTISRGDEKEIIYERVEEVSCDDGVLQIKQDDGTFTLWPFASFESAKVTGIEEEDDE